MCRARDSNDTPSYLVQFNGLEQGLEVAFTETLVALALDDLEEDGPDHVRGEDLQQHTLGGLTIAVNQYPALLQLRDVFVVPRHPGIHTLVVGIRRVLEGDAATPQYVHGAVDVVGGQRDVLDALALVL